MEKVIKIKADNLDAIKNKRSDYPKYLNDLIVSLHTCAENYKKLAAESALSELKEIAIKLASERAEFAITLKEGFRDKSKKSHNALNKIKPLLVKLVKSVAQSKDDQAIISTILKNELNAAKKYNTYLYNHIPTVEQLHILLEQKRAVNEAIELFRAGYTLQAQGISMLATEVA
jgi:hypothetical protein